MSQEFKVANCWKKNCLKDGNIRLNMDLFEQKLGNL